MQPPFPQTISPFEKKSKTHRRWYTRWWVVLLLVCESVILILAVASSIYLFSVFQKINSGELEFDQVFNPQPSRTAALTQGQNRPFMGPADAPITVVAFMDFECEVCVGASQAMELVSRDVYYGTKARFVFRHFPNLLAGSRSVLAAVAAECGYRQGYFWEVHDVLFAVQKNFTPEVIRQAVVGTGVDLDEFARCLESAETIEVVQQDFDDGVAAGVRVSPSFVIGDKIVEGAPTAENIKKAVDLLLIVSE